MYEPLLLIVMGFGIRRVTHRARYLLLPPLDCTMAPSPDSLGQVGPCIGCNKKQSAGKTSPCTVLQKELVCQSYSQAGFCGGVCRTYSGWHLECKVKRVTDIPCLPGTASFFMLCNENTDFYLTVLHMPRAAREVWSVGDAAPCPEDCPLRQVCRGNTMVSTASHTVLATVHVPPGVGIILRYVHSGNFAVRSAPDLHFSATHGGVLWCTLLPPQTPLLEYCMARYYDWITPREKISSRVSKAATEGEPGPIWQR